MKMKKAAALAVGLMLSLSLTGCGADKIGVVDINKVMTDSSRVQQFEEELKGKARELAEKLEQDKPALSPEELQKRSVEVNTEITKKREELSKQINESLDKAIAEVAQQKKLGVVLYKNGVAQGGEDITDDIIGKMK